MPLRRLGTLLCLAVTILVLAGGCSSKPARVAASSGTDGATGSSAAAGGGYYKDDGPDAIVPASLDEIPDARPRIEPLHRATLRPYTVFGQQYVPMKSVQPYRERGHASWYGRRFHGNPTAIGEPYDMYAMSAAHKILPLPSYVRVTNLSNGRSVVVRVNDRGPFLRGRLIDLSYAAAHRLGYVNAGSAMVEVEAIVPDQMLHADAPATAAEPSLALAPAGLARQPQAAAQSEPLPTQREAQSVVYAGAAAAPALAPAHVAAALANDGGAYLQLGAFATPAGAESVVEQVRTEMGVFADRLHLLDDGGRYRLQLGPFTSVDEARIMAGRIGALLNLQPFVVMR